MRVRLAKSAGFCYGVRRAVELAEQAAQSGRRCAMLGPIIHNNSVIDYLQKQGVELLQTLDQVPAAPPSLSALTGRAKRFTRLWRNGAVL